MAGTEVAPMWWGFVGEGGLVLDAKGSRKQVAKLTWRCRVKDESKMEIVSV